MSLTIEEQLLFNYLKIVCVSSFDETEKVYQEILSSAGGSNNSGKCLKAVLSSINNAIKKYDLEIVEAIDEISSKKIHCLISTNNNTLAQKASFYDKLTCELLSKIIKACITSDSGSVSQISSLNMDVSVKSKSHLQSLLDRLIKDKWLISENGKVSLGVRCQLELELTIKKQYPNYVKYCSLCKTFLMQGKICSECESSVHYHCRRKFYEMNNISFNCNICPLCKEPDADVEMEAESVSADDMPSMGDPPAKRSRISYS